MQLVQAMDHCQAHVGGCVCVCVSLCVASLEEPIAILRDYLFSIQCRLKGAGQSQHQKPHSRDKDYAGKKKKKKDNRILNMPTLKKKPQGQAWMS